jgi:flavin-dependent dehydrogenase
MDMLDEVLRIGFRINGIELHAASGDLMQAPIPDHPQYPNYLVIAPRLQLDDAILQRAVQGGARYQSPVRVSAVESEAEHAVIHAIHNGRQTTYKARVAILAIGANMRMLLQMGALKKTPHPILAARAYFEGMSGLEDRVQAHFANVPLPGYGWVFPISKTSANVGVGFWHTRIPWRKMPASSRTAMDTFMHNPKLKEMLAQAEQVGPVKSYPLRIDFASAPTYKDRLLFVGETAGLVSPLTGEGIDFAMESGKLAAEFLAGSFERGDLATSSLAAYDQILRDHFQRIFVFLDRVRRTYLNPLVMNRAIAAAAKRPELRKALVNVMMSQQHPADLINVPTLRKVFLGI